MPDSATIVLVRSVSVKLPAELHAALSKEVPRRKVSPWSLVRQVIAHALRDREGAPPPSCAGLAGDLIGAVHSGRSDVVTIRAFSTRLSFRIPAALPLTGIGDG